MERATLTVTNNTGLHARPVDLFVRTAQLYSSDIVVRKGAKHADAKNIVRVILLNVARGESIQIEAEGDDAAEAIADLSTLVTSNFVEVNARVTV